MYRIYYRSTRAVVDQETYAETGTRQAWNMLLEEVFDCPDDLIEGLASRWGLRDRVLLMENGGVIVGDAQDDRFRWGCDPQDLS